MLFTSEQVSGGHPDKICDQIADAVLTDCLRHDPESRVAIECLIKDNVIVLAGELTSEHMPDTNALAHEVLRRIGVQDALAMAGQNSEDLTRICCTAFTMEEGERCMKELLTARPELDGVVCVTDTVAFGAMRALREAGRHVGQDVGLAGVGDSWAGSMMEPGLATVRFYQKQVGQEAARMLLQSLEHTGADAAPVRQTTLGYTLVERGSL